MWVVHFLRQNAPMKVLLFVALAKRRWTRNNSPWRQTCGFISLSNYLNLKYCASSIRDVTNNVATRLPYTAPTKIPCMACANMLPATSLVCIFSTLNIVAYGYSKVVISHYKL